MSTESLWSIPLDAQRYDLSKRRKPSTLTISSTSTMDDRCEALDKFEPISVSPKAVIGDLWEDHTTAVLSSTSSLGDEEASLVESNSRGSSSDETCTSTLSVASTFLTREKETYYTDVFEREGYTTVRTIVRPSSPRPAIFNFFSRPSCPTLEGVPLTSRPTPPFGLFNNLNCMRSADVFEEELDFIEKERQKELNRRDNSVAVWVERDCSVLMEESWRSGVQAILYGQAPPPDSVVGRVEVW
ncbi:hypothetical protein M413DRAFT_31378 [Hebeloma cylindrosporum]|uniref:Uncharacterized protein n=1 Tax=Hebeloma cylindrosporum TaxID=76867 RepID=A0A0C2Y6U0_HEBCY|nr:hypothetical protein M413DRAFT_31378 [Hebeloma cylindrosporum h7]